MRHGLMIILLVGGVVVVEMVGIKWNEWKSMGARLVVSRAVPAKAALNRSENR